MQRPLIFAWFLTGCAQLSVNNPNPRIDVPETRGSKGLKIEAALTPSHSYESVNNGGLRPPNFAEPSTARIADFMAGASYAPLPQLEIGFETNLLASGLGLVARYQLFGKGLVEAKKGNFSTALTVRVGSAFGSNKGDQSTTFGPGGYYWEGKIQSSYSHLGTSVGWRLQDKLLAYVGGAVSKYSVTTRIDQSSVSGDPGGSYKYSSHGHAHSEGLGLIYGDETVQFGVSAMHSHIGYKLVEDINEWFYSANISWAL